MQTTRSRLLDKFVQTLGRDESPFAIIGSQIVSYCQDYWHGLSLRAMCMKLKNNSNEHLSVVPLGEHLSNEFRADWLRTCQLIPNQCKKV